MNGESYRLKEAKEMNRKLKTYKTKRCENQDSQFFYLIKMVYF